MESGFSSIVALWKDLVGCSEPKVAKMQREMSNRGNGLTDGLVRSLGGKKKIYIYDGDLSLCCRGVSDSISDPDKDFFSFSSLFLEQRDVKGPT